MKERRAIHVEHRRYPTGSAAGHNCACTVNDSLLSISSCAPTLENAASNRYSLQSLARSTAQNESHDIYDCIELDIKLTQLRLKFL